jgi:hypothetical protein
MAKGKTLAEAVMARVKPSRRGFKSWFDRLSPELQAELELVRSQFDHKIHEKTSYAQAVIDEMGSRGIKTSGIQGVIKWLNKKV